MGKLGILTGLGPVVAGSNPADPILKWNILKTKIMT